jgi:sirohydrochlorin cobaltochelatase
VTEESGLAVVLCGHGTRHADGAAEFRVVAERVRARLPRYKVDYGFLELSEPLLPDALERLAAQGARRIVVIPCMLFAAGHAKTDIPNVIRAFETRHPDVEVIYGRVFGIDPSLLTAAADRISEALAAAGPAVPRDETLLLVLGRGSSDPDANGDLSKVMRLLWEGLGFGWGELGYFDVTFPHLEPAIDHAARLGYRRIVVFPYLLFTGVLVRRLRETLAAAALRYPQLEFVEAPYLKDHPGVVDVFAARIEGALAGDVAMNCRLCRFRSDILAFERPGGDHDHDCDHDHDDHGHDGCHGHDHDGHDHPHHDHDDVVGCGHDKQAAVGPAHHGHGHDHGHGPGHPFADHPNGPRSKDRWPVDG